MIPAIESKVHDEFLLHPFYVEGVIKSESEFQAPACVEKKTLHNLLAIDV